MPQSLPRSQEVITEFRQMLPAQCATARAIDQHEPWERVASKAVDDGYIESTGDFDFFIDVCVHRNS